MSKKFTLAISRPVIVDQYTEIEIEADSAQQAEELAKDYEVIEALNPKWYCADGNREGCEFPWSYIDEALDLEELEDRLCRISVNDVYETGTK